MGDVVYLSEVKARNIVDDYMRNEGVTRTTQEILDSGIVPKLKGFIVQPGKVSDSIYGGKGNFVMKKKTWENYRQNIQRDDYTVTEFTEIEKGKEVQNVRVEFENPELYDRSGVPLRIMVRSERISTHDVGRGIIPFKDQILAMNHNFMRELVRREIGTSQYDIAGLDSNAVVIAAENLTPVKFENVLREYMARTTTKTSLFYAWQNGEKEFAGRPIPPGLFPNCKLPLLWETPSTKGESDMTVSPQWLIDNGICTEKELEYTMSGAKSAFRRVSDLLDSSGIILVDTKIEHGRDRFGHVVSQDELFTMDSSRFWLKEDYKTQLTLFLEGRFKELEEYIRDTQPGINEKEYKLSGQVVITPRSYSKEFARGYSTGDNPYSDEERALIAVRYIMGIQHLLNIPFKPDMRPREERVVSGLETIVERLAA